MERFQKQKRNRLNMRKKDELMEKMIKLDTRVRTRYTVCSTTSYTGCSATWEFPIKCGVLFQFSIQGMFIDDFVY